MTIPTTLIIRSCYDELVDPCDYYSFHLCSAEPDLLQSEFSDRSTSSSTGQRLLVGGLADQRGARPLVSGVEKINTLLEERSTSRSGDYQHGARRLDSLTNSPLA